MNLPNKLTVFRIILIPIIVLVYIFPYASYQINMPTYFIGGVGISLINIIVLLLFLTASITDFMDGYIARKHHLITTFGKFADPIADKILVNTLLILLASDGLVPVVAVLLMTIRDVIVDGCRMIAATNGVIVSADLLGKIKTFLQMIAIMFTLLNNLPFEIINIPFSNMMIWFATFVSVLSGLAYFNQLKEYIFESK